LLAGLDWLDSLSLTGLDGQNLNEIGLKNGSLIVDDQQRGNKWNFQNISLSMRRPSGGGVALSLAEEGAQGWSLRVAVGPPANGVRSVDIKADKVSTTNILLAMRLKDMNYSANLPISGELKGELGRDGLPTFFNGRINIGAGHIIDGDTPDYPMAIDSAEVDLQWDAGRRVLVAPFKIVSGPNRITLLAHLEPPNDSVPDWQLGFSGGTILLPGTDGEAPLMLAPLGGGSVNEVFRVDSRLGRFVVRLNGPAWRRPGVDRGRELRRGTRQDCGWKKGGKLTEQIRRLGAVGRAFVAEQTRDRDRGAQPRGGDERTEEKPRRRGRGK